eukprot:6201424-Pleurochrysis_carterae.AAC.2
MLSTSFLALAYLLHLEVDVRADSLGCGVLLDVFNTRREEQAVPHCPLTEKEVLRLFVKDYKQFASLLVVLLPSHQYAQSHGLVVDIAFSLCRVRDDIATTKRMKSKPILHARRLSSSRGTPSTRACGSKCEYLHVAPKAYRLRPALAPPSRLHDHLPQFAEGYVMQPRHACTSSPMIASLRSISWETTPARSERTKPRGGGTGYCSRSSWALLSCAKTLSCMSVAFAKLNSSRTCQNVRDVAHTCVAPVVDWECLYQALSATAASGSLGGGQVRDLPVPKQVRCDTRGLGRQANCACLRRRAVQRGESARSPRASLSR